MSIMQKISVALLTLAISVGVCRAQSTPPTPNRNQAQVFNSFTLLGRTADIAVTTVSQDVVIPVQAPVAVFYNTGSNYAYVALNGIASSVTAANGTPVPPGSCVAMNAQSMGHVQAITSTSATTLQVAVGWGSPGACNGASGGGGGGGNVNLTGINGVAPGLANPLFVSPGTGATWQLGAGSASIGSIANTSFGISGTLPAFAATPTFNIGTAPTLTVSGTVAATQSGAWNITNVSGTVSLPTGASTSANQPTNAAIASTTAGQTGNLHMGAVTTGAPTYTTGQTDPLSLTTAGALRVDASGTTQPVSGTITANQGGSWTTTSNQGGTWTVTANQGGTWNITNISGTISLPTGAATSANQQTNVAAASTTAGQTGGLQMGAVTTGAPTYVTGQSNYFSLTTAGALRVDASATTQPVSGTVTAAQATAANLNATVVPSSVSAWGLTASTQNGATPTNGQLSMGQFNTAPTTITTGNVSPLQLDSAANLLVNVKTGTLAVTQATAASLNATVVGTGTFAVQAAQSGTWNITNISGTVSLPTGAATSALQPTNAAAASTTSGQTGLMNLAAVTTGSPTYTTGTSNFLSLTTAGALRVDSSATTQPVSGTVAATQSGAWNITNISGTVSLPTGAATSSNQQTNAAQGSTTAGQTGGLTLAAVTTAAPSYTTAQTSPLSLTTGGALRTDSTTIGGVAMSAGAGAVGTGSQRIAVGQDTTTIAGSAPGVAGTPSTNVISVQGTASGTNLPVSSADGALTTIGNTADSVWPGTGSGSVVAILKALVSTAGQSITISGSITNPVSTLTLPATTTAYTAGQLIANSATAGSVVNPAFAIATSGGGASISRVRLSTNDTTSTAWGAQTVQIDLWTASPTWTNGDRGTWSPATGTASHLASYVCVMSAELGDGAYAECGVSSGNFAAVKLASGTSVFWSLKSISGSGVTGASKIWTLTAELMN